VRASDDLTPQTLRQVVQKLLLLCKVVCGLLIVLKVALDLHEKSVGHVGSLLEFLQHAQFLLEFFAGSVNAGNQISHVSDGVRVSANSENHPADRIDAFVDSLGTNVSEAHGGQGLEGPVESHQVLHFPVIVHHSFPNYPSVWIEIVQLGDEKPKAGDDMGHEEHGHTHAHDLGGATG